MCRIVLPLLVVLGFVAAPVFAAAKNEARANWPTPGQVGKAVAQVKWDTGNTANAKFRSKAVKFAPADLSGYKDHEIMAGVVFGKIVSEGASKGGLPAGEYVVYIRKSNGWEIYFCQNGAPMAKSKEVTASDHNSHEPSFLKEGAFINYYYITFEW